VPTKAAPDDDPETTFDELIDDADLLNEAQREKLHEIRDHFRSISAMREMVAAAEDRGKRDMARLLKTLREKREMLDAARGRKRD